MKLLLVAVNAKFIHTNLAVHSIKGYLERGANKSLNSDRNSMESVRIDIAEFTINQTAADILADIYAVRPDVVAFSCYIWNWEMIRRLLDELPKIMPSVPVWLGGPEVSYDGERIMERFPAVAGVVIGEGEETFQEVVAFYGSCGPRLENTAGAAAGDRGLMPAPDWDWSGIRGIVYRHFDGRIIHNACREPANINHLAFSYDALAGDDLKNRIIYYESSRGCPFRCSYCLSAAEATVRYKDIEKVKDELASILAHDVAQVKFVDRTFNSNHEHAAAIWQFIRDNDNGVTNYHFEVAADILTDAEAELLKTFRPGLVQLEIGVQTTHPATLKSINRKMDFNRLEKVVADLKKNRNIHIHLDLIAGLPFEDYGTFARSFNEVYALAPEKLQLGFLKVLPGTPIRRDAEKLGIVYEAGPPYQVLYTKWLSYGEMRRLCQIESMVDIFYNTNQFMNTIAVLELAFLSPFQMYEKLADFFRERDYFRKKPARVFRYQALLDFALKHDAGNEECYRELLTHDMYLREKTKTRPDFAHDLSPYREKIRALDAGLEKERVRMTAIEVFYYHVDAEKGKDKLRRDAEPRFIRYDYQKRDVLTNNATAAHSCEA